MPNLLFASPISSVRWRILRSVTLTILVIWGLAALLSYRQAKREVQELMDGQMVKTARLLLAQVGTDQAHLQQLPSKMENVRGTRKRRSEMPLEFQIGPTDGPPLVQSSHAPNTSLKAHLGYENIVHAGEPWRSLIMETTDGRYRVQVAHSIASRDKEALEISNKTVQPLALLLPLMIPLIYFSVRRGLKPLDALANEVSSRTPDNLQTLTPSLALQETQPLVVAINRLFERLAATLENERRFTADAAHELRTPLAALKIHTQVAMASTDPAQQERALSQILAGADRSTRLVEQLLRLARLDPLQALPNPQPIALATLAEQTVDDALTVAASKQQTLLALSEGGPLPSINGDPDLLSAALRNLIDNAVRYTPDGGQITVLTTMQDGDILLSVSDNGPGISPDELPRLLERFYRGRDAEAEGSGLGLAIVRRIAELHGAQLTVENRAGGGFTAALRWAGTSSAKRST